MGIRTHRFEVYPDAAEKDVRRAISDRWQAISDSVTEMANAFYETWLIWHVHNKSRSKIQTWKQLFAAWKKAEKDGSDRGPKPKCPVEVMSAALSKEIYDRLKVDFPQVHNRPPNLLTQRLALTLTNLKASRGSWAGWMEVLCNRQGLPQFTKPMPIPFDKRNCEIDGPGEDGRYRIGVRLSAYEGGGVSRKSVIDYARIVLPKGRGAGTSRAILDRIISGEYSFKGSSLAHDPRRGKWYALLAYELPDGERPVLDPAKTAQLWASKAHPWVLRIGKRNQWVGGTGAHVSGVRQALMMQRRGRHENYRYAGSATKGHGRRRALDWMDVFMKRWRDFCKEANHQVTKRVVDACVQAGCGVIVYWQPAGKSHDNRFLSVAGKGGGRSTSSWDWFQVGSLLRYKCEKVGIQVVVMKAESLSASDLGTLSRIRKGKGVEARAVRVKMKRKKRSVEASADADAGISR